MEFKYIFKYILIGDYDTGKSAIIDRFIYNNFNNLIAATVGIEFNTKIIKINDTHIKITLWDTSGQERFRAITESYLRKTTCVLLIFDLTNKDTFLNIKYWLEKFRLQNNENTVCMLIGAKSDLKSLRVVSDEEINKFTKENNLKYYETSSKSNRNIDEIFEISAEMVLKKINENNLKEFDFQDMGIKLFTVDRKKKEREKIYCCNIN